jgi:hypothetical protein
MDGGWMGGWSAVKTQYGIASINKKFVPVNIEVAALSIKAVCLNLKKFVCSHFVWEKRLLTYCNRD